MKISVMIIALLGLYVAETSTETLGGIDYTEIRVKGPGDTSLACNNNLEVCSDMAESLNEAHARRSSEETPEQTAPIDIEPSTNVFTGQ